jgi:hypothetical protein
MFDYVDEKHKICTFGYGGIEVGRICNILTLKGIKPKQKVGAYLFDVDNQEKIGNWEYTGSQLYITFNTIDEIDTFFDRLDDIENNEGGAFNVNGITLDFINYNKESVDVLRSFIPRIRLSIIRLIAC